LNLHLSSYGLKKNPLYALSYLLQLTNENVNQKMDIIWDLTKQLLIAHHMKMKNQIPDPKVIQKNFDLIKENEVIKEMLKAKLITTKILKEILTVEELFNIWIKETQAVIKDKMETNIENIKDYYESNQEFLQKDVYEIYECTIETSVTSHPQSPEELKSLGAKDIKLLGTFSLQQLQNQLLPHLIDLSPHDLPKIFSGNSANHYFFIYKFYENYKAPYESVKENLLQFLFEKNLEDEIEETSQNLIELYQIEYNELLIKQLMSEE
jgi:hypothetical protein